MYFLLLGIAGLLLKYLEISPVAELSWWMVLVPFGLAVAWWSWADASGYTKRKEMEKMEDRTKKRLEKQRDALGMLKKRR
jgi:small Trp-rich protein